MPDHLTFAQWVKQNRQALELTQEVLAQQVGCSAVGLRKIEAGTLRPSKALALRLITHFNVPLAEQAAFVEWARAIDAETPSASRPRAGRKTDRPPPAAPAARHQVPMPLTSFVGREQE